MKTATRRTQSFAYQGFICRTMAMLLVVAAMAGMLTVPARSFGGDGFYRSWGHGMSPR